MLSLSAGGVTTVAHGIHYAIVAVGAVGIVALIGPRFLPTPTRPRDEHEARVLALRAAITNDPLGPPVAAPTAASRVRFHEPVLTTAQRALLPLAVLSSAAAAGVHAAVGPAHFREGTLFGLFFATSALLQILWAGAVAVRASHPLLVAGAVGNVLVVVLWAVTRTAGLPFGLLPEPEAVGPWDVACGVWELIVVVACIAMLHGPGRLPTRLVELRRWHGGVKAFAVGSVLLLVALSLSGASA